MAMIICCDTIFPSCSWNFRRHPESMGSDKEDYDTAEQTDRAVARAVPDCPQSL